jgi:hypothetical protein
MFALLKLEGWELTSDQKALGKPMWPEYYGMMEPNAVKMAKTLYEDGKNGKVVMDLYPLLKQVR